jgi:hypothetical protein
MSSSHDKKTDKNRKHRKHESSSDSSSTESPVPQKCVNKKIANLAEKIEENKHKDKKVEAKLENQIEKLEHKLKENKEKDKKVENKLENQIEKLEHKLNCIEKDKLKYKTIVHRLRREKCLMVNGVDAYGSFFSTTSQTVKPNDPVKLDKKVNTLNIKLRSNGSAVKILREGMYVFNLTAQFDQPCQVALFINDEPELSTVVSSSNPNNFVSMHQVLRLYENDIVSFRNYLSLSDITTSVGSSGLVPCSVNVELSLWRIAPIPEKHCLPPPLNENPWCYTESSSSSDSESS